MVQQVLYDTATGVILQWQDTAAFGYPADPAGTAVLAVTSTEWATQATPQHVSAGALADGGVTATSPTQAYAAFIAAGLTVTSTGTPALNGLYAIDATSQQDIATEAQFISTFGEFTTGATTNLPWPMPNGSVVTFPTTASFLSFAKVAGQAVAAAKLAVATGGTLPPATATIP